MYVSNVTSGTKILSWTCELFAELFARSAYNLKTEFVIQGALVEIFARIYLKELAKQKLMTYKKYTEREKPEINVPLVKYEPL